MSRKNTILTLAGLAVIAILVALLPDDASAQRRGGGWGRGYYGDPPERDIFPGNSFTFCRIRYDSQRGWGRRGGDWSTDYPDSDLNFPQRLSELTTINVNRDENGNVKHVIVDLLEDELFHYPWAYMIEVGDIYFSEQQAAKLREYLLRGGFLMVDDFWGTQAWANFEYEFSKVLPPDEYPIVDIPLSHEIFHIVFPVDEVPQVPSIGHWERYGGDTSERGADSATPHCRGVFDKKGRLMAVIMHNTDLGDGWEEEAVNPHYFEQISAKKAYPLGINIVVYAMTH